MAVVLPAPRKPPSMMKRSGAALGTSVMASQQWSDSSIRGVMALLSSQQGSNNDAYGRFMPITRVDWRFKKPALTELASGQRLRVYPSPRRAHVLPLVRSWRSHPRKFRDDHLGFRLARRQPTPPAAVAQLGFCAVAIG